MQEISYRDKAGELHRAMEFFQGRTETETREQMKARFAELEGEHEIISMKREKIGRNAPCPCGSGVKFKKCCIDKVRL